MTNIAVRKKVSPWDEMDRMWNSMINEARNAPRTPIVHVDNNENEVTVKAELPGFGPEDIDIQVKENVLTLQALKSEAAEEQEEKKNVVYEKSFVIPEDLNRDAFEAEMKNGLLTLVLPRQEKPAPLTIQVKG